MLKTSRSIFSDNGVLTDISVETNDYKNQTVLIPAVTAEDFLYVASDFPFNHRYIDVSVANTASANLKIEVWDGTNWAEAHDVIDQTSMAGVPFSQSGHISFRPDTDEGWMREDTNDDNETVTGLTTIKIFNMYWARFSWDSTLDVTTAVNFIGHKFSEDDDLEVAYPVLNNAEVLTQFEPGKTNWNPQHFYAAELIIKDLKRRNIILTKNQILEWEFFKDASIHKVAETAYRAFGKDFETERNSARDLYQRALDMSIYLIDENNNAVDDVREHVSRQRFLTR